LNSKDNLDAVRTELLQQLQDLQGAPSVAMHEVPPLFERTHRPRSAEEDDADERDMGKTKDGDGSRRVHGSELYDQVD